MKYKSNYDKEVRLEGRGSDEAKINYYDIVGLLEEVLART